MYGNEQVLLKVDGNKFGLGPIHTLQGDLVALMAGAGTPLVLRPTKDGKFELIGECYIHGVTADEGSVRQMELIDFLLV
jgi:hypothetical protein